MRKKNDLAANEPAALPGLPASLAKFEVEKAALSPLRLYVFTTTVQEWKGPDARLQPYRGSYRLTALSSWRNPMLSPSLFQALLALVALFILYGRPAALTPVRLCRAQATSSRR